MLSESVSADSLDMVSCPLPKHFRSYSTLQLHPWMHFCGENEKHINSVLPSFLVTIQLIGCVQCGKDSLTPYVVDEVISVHNIEVTGTFILEILYLNLFIFSI